ncbi:MAG: DUF1841 family protein [Burkholderiaceae bacterium]|jgi:hypothetical protein|nr:DUF1841 family protein [Pseudomonadota bacterium]MBS0598431.1 DUF1841 family protein [Pseudomonadota bacterium]MCO5116064.1 DUF1841 family protein [Burkholderiaceae bacterium]MCP5219884.1 DUF1841 family protein [Burkholderiaceae bacterium]
MFAPTQEQVRRFFCEAWAKSQAGQPLQAIEQLAAGWVAEHPEWHAELADADAAVARDYGEGAVGGNPFLHLSMHLSISEQCSIDQPAGIRQAVELLAARRGDLHTAHHEVMDCLGQMLADAQARRGAPDGAAYLDCVRRRATGP